MDLKTVISVVAVLAAVVIPYVILFQRKLVHLDELCSNALSQIGVQMNSRWDALTALSETMKGYAQYERTTLTDVVGQRVHLSPQASPEEINRQETLLSSAFGRLMAVSEAYPDLKADTLYQTTMENVKSLENDVRMSRMVYNDAVTKMNRAARMFPGSLFTGMLGFDVRPYLQEPAGKTEMPSLK